MLRAQEKIPTKKESIKIPEGYICSITRQIMMEPVFTSDGYTYEKEKIEEWLKTHNTNPETNETLEHKQLIPNRRMKSDISAFLDKHPELYEGDDIYLPNAWMKQLVVAIKNKDIASVRDWIGKDRRLLTLELENNYTAFYLACQFGSADLVKFLLQKLQDGEQLAKTMESKPDDLKPIYLNSLLEGSLIKGDKETSSLLLKLGAEIEQPDNKGNTLLHRLVIQGKEEGVSWLLEQGASIEKSNYEGNTALLLAASHGNVKLMQLLLSRGANAEAVNNKKENTMHIGAKRGDLVMLKKLQEKDLNYLMDVPNKDGDNALHLAAAAGQNEVIRFLLELGINHKIENNQKETAIEVAKREGKVDSARVIEVTARELKRAKLEEVVVLRQIVKEQGIRIKQLEEEVDKIKELMGLKEAKKEEGLVISNITTFTPSFKLVKAKSRAKLNVSPEEVQVFLNYVAAGQQLKAEEMLKKNPELAQAKGTVTDPAKRTFKDITGFQYAVWALDWHMWKMIRKYLPPEEAREQAKEFGTGAWVQEHGEHAGWAIQKVTNAQQVLNDNWGKWDWTQRGQHWVQQVGGAQLILPMHVLQEYSNPSRPFDPCPNFKDIYDLERNLPDWLQIGYADHSLSEKWAVSRGPWATVSLLRDWIVLIELDRMALVELSNTRTQQRGELVADLVKENKFSPINT